MLLGLTLYLERQKIMDNFDIAQEVVEKAHEYIFSKLIFLTFEKWNKTSPLKSIVRKKQLLTI